MKETKKDLTVGDILRTYRAKKGYTLTACAKLAKVSSSTLSYLETGHRVLAGASAESLERIADVLDIDSAQLVALAKKTTKAYKEAMYKSAQDYFLKEME